LILRDRGIAALATSELISTFGTRLTVIALPWFVLVTTGSAARMAFVLAAGVLPLAAFGIPSSALVNRFGARHVLAASDFARAPLIALIPALHELHVLSFPLLLAIVFCGGLAGAPYFASKRLILPELIGADPKLVSQANSVIEGANRITGLLGPVAAGFLISEIGASSVLWLDALSFLTSFVLIFVFVRQREPVTAEVHGRGGVAAALRFLARDRLLGGMALTTVLFGSFWPVIFASLPVLAYMHHRDPKLAGYLFACWGAGSSGGSVLAFTLARRVAPLRMARGAIIGVTLPLGALAASASPWIVGTVLAITGLFIPLLNAPVFSTFALRTPAVFRAPVMTAVTTSEELAGPLVLTAAGPAIQAFGLRPTYAFVACGAAAAAVMFLFATQPPRRLVPCAVRRRG
jgi:MFS family permease